jgi:hypothetical protein
LQRLSDVQVRINPAGQQLVANEKFQTLKINAVIATIQTTVAGLGLLRGGTFSHILEAAAATGLSVCPLELGPHLRLVLLDQAEGLIGFAQTQHQAPPGLITVASAPLSEDDELPRGFYLRRMEGGLWLRGYKSWSSHVWKPEDTFVLQTSKMRLRFHFETQHR